MDSQAFRNPEQAQGRMAEASAPLRTACAIERNGFASQTQAFRKSRARARSSVLHPNSGTYRERIKPKRARAHVRAESLMALPGEHEHA